MTIWMNGRIFMEGMRSVLFWTFSLFLFHHLYLQLGRFTQARMTFYTSICEENHK